MSAPHVVNSNPFSTRFIRPGAIPFVFADGQSPEALVERLRQNHWWGQITGPHGSGKSTLLAAFIPYVEAAGRQVNRMTMHEGEHRLPRNALSAVDETTQCVIDGYEQLGWFSRFQVKLICRRRGCGLLVTTHDDVGLPTLYRTGGSEEIARQIVERLVPRGDEVIGPADIAESFAAVGGNVREMLFRLFDLYQQRRG